MSLAPRPIECLACGHLYAGLWDIGSVVQPEGQKCPKCGSRHTREGGKPRTEPTCCEPGTVRAPLDSANHFSVVRTDSGFIQIMNLGVHGRSSTRIGPIVLDEAETANLMAWLFCVAGPAARKEFCRTVEEINASFPSLASVKIRRSVSSVKIPS